MILQHIMAGSTVRFSALRNVLLRSAALVVAGCSGIVPAAGQQEQSSIIIQGGVGASYNLHTSSFPELPGVPNC